MNLRRLNDEGTRRMESFLDSLTTDSPEAYPEQLLTDPAASEGLAVEVPVDRAEFPRRFELAEYLYTRFAKAGLRDPERAAGVWSWLALYWFDQLCPKGKGGQLKPGERARWVARLDSSRKGYRHLVLGPYLIYSAWANRGYDPREALALLYTRPAAPGELVGQIASTQALVTNRAVVGAATAMYINSDGRLRRGAGGRRGGSSARLRDVVGQLDLTYDLHDLNAEQLLTLLPREFEPFRRKMLRDA